VIITKKNLGISQRWRWKARPTFRVHWSGWNVNYRHERQAA